LRKKCDTVAEEGGARRKKVNSGRITSGGGYFVGGSIRGGRGIKRKAIPPYNPIGGSQGGGE